DSAAAAFDRTKSRVPASRVRRRPNRSLSCPRKGANTAYTSTYAVTLEAAADSVTPIEPAIVGSSGETRKVSVPNRKSSTNTPACRDRWRTAAAVGAPAVGGSEMVLTGHHPSGAGPEPPGRAAADGGSGRVTGRPARPSCAAAVAGSQTGDHPVTAGHRL